MWSKKKNMPSKDDKNQDKKVKKSKSKNRQVVAHENKEIQTEPPLDPDKKSWRCSSCRRNNNNTSKPAASNSANILKPLYSWVPCLVNCYITHGGNATAQLKPCICVSKCSDGELAKSIAELKRMISKSEQYPLTAGELAKGLHASQESTTGSAEDVNPKSDAKKKKQPEPRGPQKLQNSDCECTCTNQPIESPSPPKPKKR